MTVPQIDDQPLTLACFALEDIRETLRHVTLGIRHIRSQIGWKSSDLAGLKEARRELTRFLPKATTNQLTEQEHAQLQALLLRYAKVAA